MSIATHPYAGPADTSRMLDFVAAHPACSPHALDMPYRLCSPASRSLEGVRLWEDERRALAAFAVVQCGAWGTLDYAIRPGGDAPGIEGEMMAWALPRFAAITAAAGRPLHWWLDVPEGDAERTALAERHGFAPDDWHAAHLARPLDGALPEPRLPDGYAIRPLEGAAEVEAYVALHRAAFASESMTAAWRRATLEVRGHAPELDLVAVAPDGTLAGFCIGWLGRGAVGDVEAQVEPVGVHPAQRGKGLGSGLLAEMFRRMRAAGAAVAHVDIYSDNPGGLRLYESVGYRPVRRVLKYYRRFEP